ncbi:hypothetical protein P3S67_004472 [Capsicum chacoense]
MKHFSHPHALELPEVQQSNETVCSGCENKLCGTSYKCTKPNYSMYFGCNACGEEPKCFVYECLECNFSLHAKCATSWPEYVTREDHQHSLVLQYQWPFPIDDYVRIFCEVCNGLCNDANWLYYCAQCKLGTHLQCATVKKEDGSSFENEEVEMTNEQKLMMATIKAQGQQARLNFQAQMAYMNAQAITNMWRSHHRYD